MGQSIQEWTKQKSLLNTLFQILLQNEFVKVSISIPTFGIIFVGLTQVKQLQKGNPFRSQINNLTDL